MTLSCKAVMGDRVCAYSLHAAAGEVVQPGREFKAERRKATERKATVPQLTTSALTTQRNTLINRN